jgi:hypothetical protein
MAEVVVIDHGRGLRDHCVRGADLDPHRVIDPGGGHRLAA